MAFTTRFAPCSVSAHGTHYWTGPDLPDVMTGPARCLYCDVPLVMAVTIPVCGDCGMDLPDHKPKCKAGKA